MNTKLIEDIAAAVLYEGYILYPYRATAIKNKQRWTFGVLYPRAYAEQQSGPDAHSMHNEFLVRAGAEAAITVRVRFLHLIARTVEGQPWQGAMEQEASLSPFRLSDLENSPISQEFDFPAAENRQAITIAVKVAAQHLVGDVFKIRVSISNAAAFSSLIREEALMASTVSTHAILGMEDGKFVSLLDPPDELRDLPAECKNVGAWPVLVGEPGSRDAMLASPIILYDYPQIAPESPGALFDGTEIDEILTLRIMTLTDDEKRAMGLADERAREILERTESMPVEQFMKMHGVLRGFKNADQETA